MPHKYTIHSEHLYILSHLLTILDSPNSFPQTSLSHAHVSSFCFVTHYPGGHLSDYGRELKALLYQNELRVILQSVS